jgi:hypothetical protein
VFVPPLSARRTRSNAPLLPRNNDALNLLAMKSGARSALLLACLALTAVPASAEPAGNGRFWGLLRSRDLTPFGFLRLDMRPAHAVSIEPGTFAFETELGYQNTWALSRNVERHLKSLEASGQRRRMDAGLVQEIRALPGENYLLDLESATLDVAVHYKLSNHWSAYAIATAVSYHGGFLDWSIERFHRWAGFGSFGRHAIERNGTSLVYDLKNTQVVLLDPPQSEGFLDPTLGLRYSGITLPRGWDMSMEVATKIAVDGERPLLSTGRSDHGFQASLRRLGGRNAFHLDLAAVFYAGQRAPSPQDSQLVPTIVLGWEHRLTARTNLNLQGYASKSVYGRAQTDLEELREDKYQLSLGLRHRFDNSIVSFAITENLQNFNNTPDVGFQFGFAWL